LAQEVLSRQGIRIRAYTLEAAGITAATYDPDVIEQNPLRCPDPAAAAEMERLVLEARDQGDSVGGVVEVRIENPPAGLGEPVFDKLEADLAHSLMSIGAIKGFEVGNGFAAARLRGSENNDPMYFDERSGRVRTRTNRAGGISGGISNGEDIVVRIAVKPPSSIRKEQETTTVDGKAATISVEGRHDPCICPRVVPVAEAMVALTILDHITRQSLLKKPASAAEVRRDLSILEADIAILQSQRRALKKGIGKSPRKRVIRLKGRKSRSRR
jgi:chorismate synthase